MKIRGVFFSSLVFVLSVLPLNAQNQPYNVQLANLQADVDRLDQIVRALRVEVEALARENRQLRDWVNARVSTDQQQFVTLTQFQSALRDLEARVQSLNNASRESIIRQVASEIESLAGQTQSAISALSKSVASQPQLQQSVTFNDNYPKTGSSYTVKSGDSLAKIARQLNSSVEWIRNANRLATDVIYPGQELFIPQKD